MTPAQKRKRRRLEGLYGRPPPQATRDAVAELVRRVVPPGAEVEMHSDDHPSYPRALEQLEDRSLITLVLRRLLGELLAGIADHHEADQRDQHDAPHGEHQSGVVHHRGFVREDHVGESRQRSGEPEQQSDQ